MSELRSLAPLANKLIDRNVDGAILSKWKHDFIFL